MDDIAWKKLRRQIKREQARYDGPNRWNKQQRDMAAAMSSAYGSVLRMMDKIEATVAPREP